MRTITLTLLFLSATITTVFGATGYRSGDNVIIWGPVLLIGLILLGFWLKAKIKARKQREADAAANPDTTED